MSRPAAEEQGKVEPEMARNSSVMCVAQQACEEERRSESPAQAAWRHGLWCLVGRRVLRSQKTRRRQDRWCLCQVTGEGRAAWRQQGMAQGAAARTVVVSRYSAGTSRLAVYAFNLLRMYSSSQE